MASNQFIVPWLCLQDASPAKIVPKSNPTKPKTFAQALKNVCDIPMSQLPQTTVKGKQVAISIPDEEYELGLEDCKNNLHGRIIWPKGATPLTVYALREKLKGVWQSFGHWGVSSIGRGYYEFCFSSIEDARRARSVGSLNLNPGFLKLFTWTKEFSPNTQKNSTAQVWLRIYGLAQEYWRPKILFAIASSAGSPICTDENTGKNMIDRTFGQFARILIDIDLEKELLFKVLVERKGFAMFVDLDYEQIPEYCTSCRMIGHQLSNCRKNENNDTITKEKEHKRINEKGKNKLVSHDKPQEVTNTAKVVISLEEASQLSNVENLKQNDVVDEDPLLRDIIRSKEMGATTQMVDVINLAAETLPVQLVQVGDSLAHDYQMTEVHNRDQPFPDMRITGPWCDAVTDLDYCQDYNNSDLEHDFGSDRRQLALVAPPIPAAVQRDMDFLSQSWDNMAEVDPDQQFQMVVSKKKKKNQKQQTKASKGPYPTRFRVSTSKGFQLKL